MHPKISALLLSLTQLDDAIVKVNLPDQTFVTSLGWNHPCISPTDLINFIRNIKSQLNNYTSLDIPKGLEETIDGLIESVEQQTGIIGSYLLNDSGRVTPIIPSTLSLLQIISNEIETELFSWNQIDNKKLIPKNLKNRLRVS